LRVGISTIQGLALASRKPCVGVSALQAWALGVAGCAEAIVTLLDALRDDAYGQVFDALGLPLGPAGVGRVAELAARAPVGAAFVGDAVAASRPVIEAGCRGARFPARSPFLAAEVATLASREAAAGRTLAPEALRPLYLREAELRKSSPA
jgi:tRNA threonylcarbamoyladenosine biosynthesis protein TsaB